MEKPNNNFSISESIGGKPEFLTITADKSLELIPVSEVKAIRVKKAAGSMVSWWELVIDTGLRASVTLEAFQLDDYEKACETAKDVATRLFGK